MEFGRRSGSSANFLSKPEVPGKTEGPGSGGSGKAGRSGGRNVRAGPEVPVVGILPRTETWGLWIWAEKLGENDEDINTIVTPTAPTATYTGPITRARARQLNYQVLSFLGNDSNVHENMMLPKLDTFVLLTNEGPSLEKDEHWSKITHGVDGMRKGIKNGVTSDDFRTLKPP